MSLQVGQIVEYDARVWRVGLVNASRARLDPVSGTTHMLLTAKFLTYGASVNVSPTSPLDTIPDKQLSPEQHKRAENLAHRSEDSLIIAQPEEEHRMATAEATVAAPVKTAPKPPKAAAPASTVAQPTVSANKQSNKERLASIKAKAAETKEAKAAAKVAAPPKEKTVRPCYCGCGEQVTSYFAQGHDARFKGWMIKVERGTMAVKDLPPVVQKSNQFVKKGEGYVTVKNYKGEPHSGYDKAQA